MNDHKRSRIALPAFQIGETEEVLTRRKPVRKGDVQQSGLLKAVPLNESAIGAQHVCFPVARSSAARIHIDIRIGWIGIKYGRNRTRIASDTRARTHFLHRRKRNATLVMDLKPVEPVA